MNLANCQIMSPNMILKNISTSSTIHAGKTEAALVAEVKDAIKGGGY